MIYILYIYLPKSEIIYSLIKYSPLLIVYRTELAVLLLRIELVGESVLSSTLVGDSDITEHI